uniref:Panulirin n=1 Tax=Panulirus japonicus TaxID=6736 RepID=M1H0T4_PANJA|nr:panulirin precursor [Panulirus japonicus]
MKTKAVLMLMALVLVAATQVHGDPEPGYNTRSCTASGYFCMLPQRCRGSQLSSYNCRARGHVCCSSQSSYYG